MCEAENPIKHILSPPCSGFTVIYLDLLLHNRRWTSASYLNAPSNCISKHMTFQTPKCSLETEKQYFTSYSYFSNISNLERVLSNLVRIRLASRFNSFIQVELLLVIKKQVV